MNRIGLANFVTRCPEYLKKRATLIELISVTDHRSLPPEFTLEETEEKDTYIVKDVYVELSDKASDAPILVNDKNEAFGYKAVPEVGTYFYKLHTQKDTPIMDIYDEFILTRGIIANYNNADNITTTYGRFILNYIILADPFGSKIPYINNVLNHKSIQRDVARLIIQHDIDKSSYDKFMNNIYFIGSITELSVPGMTVKALTTGDDVIKRRDELFEKYKDRLNDPMVIVKIEDELIAMDKKYLSDDPASGWIITSKEYDTCRKKMFITSGITEAFSSNANEYVFIPQALNERMDVTKFPAMCGDIRRGSHMRGKETAKGGEVTKLILRLCQNIAILEDDCQSNEGIDIVLYANNLNDYEGRYVLLPDGKTEVLTKNNFGQYIERTIKLRSPKHCKTKDGFCYRCFGQRYQQLQIRQAGMQAVKISSTLMYTAMKAMHKSKVSIVKISDLNDFII